MVPLTRGNSEKRKDNSIHMNELIIFNNEEFGEIRTITIDGEPWFVGKDVAAALGYKDPSSAVSKNVDLEDKTTLLIQQDGSNYKSRTTFINESGMYALIFGSKLESAKNFKHWVTSEVLPSIRKTGKYEQKQPEPTDREVVVANGLIAANEIITEQKQIIADQQLCIESQKEAIDNFQNQQDTFFATDSLRSMSTASKEIGVMGRNKLYAFLRKRGIMYYDNGVNVPYQQFVTQGYFHIKERLGKDGKYHPTTMATTKGMDFIRKVLQKEPVMA